MTTLPDSTSQKFLLLGQVRKKDRKEWGPVVVVHIDFSQTRGRKCGEDDFERWYARQQKSECLMGHKVQSLCQYPNCFVKRFLLYSNGISGENLTPTVTWVRSSMIPLSTKTSVNAPTLITNGMLFFNYFFRISENVKATTTLFVTAINVNLLDRNQFPQEYVLTPIKCIWALQDGGKYQETHARVV